MKISTKGRYALRMMIKLAEKDNGNFISLSALAKEIHENNKYLEHIIKELVKPGLVQVTRGSAGGYRLCRKPDEYTVLEILEAVEGKLAPVSCLETDTNLCSYCDECPTLLFWKDYYENDVAFLKDTTLADFVSGKYRTRS